MRKYYKIFTHNDLDGYSINVLCQFYNIRADIKNINNKNVDTELMNFLEYPHPQYDEILLCDMYMSNEVAEFIDQNIDNFRLIDHHKTGEYLNKYSWATVNSTLNGRPTCATELFYKYILRNEHLLSSRLMDEYTESVRLFDTGEYMRGKYNPKYIPTELSIMFYLYFRSYHKHIFENIKNGYILSYNDKEVTRNFINKMTIYSRNKQKDIKVINFEGYKTGVFFVEEPIYISKVLIDAKQQNPDIDIFMFVNVLNSISLRTFKDINLSIIAEKYGGGGHEMAAGLPYKSELILNLLK